MTITAETSRIQYDGDDLTAAFSYPYRFLADADLTVILTDDLLGTDVEQTLTTHYTVSGEGDPSGGTVTMVTIPTSDQHLTIYVDPALTQPTDYSSGGPFPAESHEDALDRLTLINQRSRELSDRSPTLDETDVDGSGEYDANGNLLGNLGTPTSALHATTKAYVDQAILDAGSGGLGAITILDANVDAAADISQSKLRDAQGTLGQKQTQTDPSSGLAASGLAEFYQLRYALNAAVGGTYWYDVPAISLATLAPIHPMFAGARYINGGDISTGGAGSDVVTIGAIECVIDDGGGNYQYVADAGMAKDIGDDWVEGAGVGGFPSGLTYAIDTWYHLFIIGKADGTIDYGVDTVLAATNLLADATGYTYFRRIGSVKSAGAIPGTLALISRNGRFLYLEDHQDFSDTNVATTLTTVVLDFVPTGVEVEADFSAMWFPATPDHVQFISPLQTDEDGAGALSAWIGDDDTSGQYRLRTNTSAQIIYSSGTTNNGDLSVHVNGWWDDRGEIS